MAAFSWNAFAVLDLYPDSIVLNSCTGQKTLSCVGTNSTNHNKCGRRIGGDRREQAARLIRQLGCSDPRSADVEDTLSDIAASMLCYQHEAQSATVVCSWQRLILTSPPSFANCVPSTGPKHITPGLSLQAQWDPFNTFSVYPNGDFHCLNIHGCGNPVNKADRASAGQHLSALSATHWSSTSIETRLRHVAPMLLCKRWHRGNAEMLVRDWMAVLERGEVVLPDGTQLPGEVVDTVEVVAAHSAGYTSNVGRARVAVASNISARRTAPIVHGLATPPASSSPQPVAAYEHRRRAEESPTATRAAPRRAQPEPGAEAHVPQRAAAILPSPPPERPSTPVRSPLREANASASPAATPTVPAETSPALDLPRVPSTPPRRASFNFDMPTPPSTNPFARRAVALLERGAGDESVPFRFDTSPAPAAEAQRDGDDQGDPFVQPRSEHRREEDGDGDGERVFALPSPPELLPTAAATAAATGTVAAARSPSSGDDDDDGGEAESRLEQSSCISAPAPHIDATPEEPEPEPEPEQGEPGTALVTQTYTYSYRAASRVIAAPSLPSAVHMRRQSIHYFDANSGDGGFAPLQYDPDKTLAVEYLRRTRDDASMGMGMAMRGGGNGVWDAEIGEECSGEGEKNVSRKGGRRSWWRKIRGFGCLGCFAGE